MPLQGIDVSFWQRDTYKAQIDNFGKDFVIARAAFSKTVDAYCDPIYQYAKAKGKKVGVYFFPLTSDGTPEASAEWCYKQVLGYVGNTMFVLDWESTTGTDPSNVDWATRWLKKFEELAGVKPVIYMNSFVESSYDWSGVVANNNGLWLANYGVNDGAEHGYASPKHWKTVAMHQYTSLLDGRGLDGDTFMGDTAAWDAYCKSSKVGAGATVPTLPTPTVTADKKSNEEIAGEVIAGKWGNGNERLKKLSNAGYDYSAVQKIVNQILGLEQNCKTYTVRAGDNLSSIASRYGVPWQKIASDNKIQNANLIYPGMVLKIC